MEVNDLIKNEFSDIKKILNQHTQKFEEHDKRSDAYDKKLASHDKKFNSIDKRFDILEEELHRQGILAEAQDHKIDLILEGMEILIGDRDKSPTKTEISDKFENHENRIGAIEAKIRGDF